MGYYLFAIVDNIRETLSAFAWMAGFGGLITFIITVIATGTLDKWSSEEDRNFAKFIKDVCKRFVVIFVLSAAICTVLPSQKQLAFIIAAPYIVENEDLQQAGKNTTEIIKLGTEYLKGVLNDSNRTDKES